MSLGVAVIFGATAIVREIAPPNTFPPGSVKSGNGIGRIIVTSCS